MRLSNYSAATPLITEFWQGPNESTSIGPHFQQPGRGILERHLVDVPPPNDIVPAAFTDLKRVYFTGMRPYNF